MQKNTVQYCKFYSIFSACPIIEINYFVSTKNFLKMYRSCSFMFCDLKIIDVIYRHCTEDSLSRNVQLVPPLLPDQGKVTSFSCFVYASVAVFTPAVLLTSSASLSHRVSSCCPPQVLLTVAPDCLACDGAWSCC